MAAAFGGSVRRAPRRPSSSRRAGGRSSTRRSRSREASTISGRTGPLDPGHFDASRGDMSVLVQQKGSGARAIAQGPCYDGDSLRAAPFLCPSSRARAWQPRRCASSAASGRGGQRRAQRTIYAAEALEGCLRGSRSGRGCPQCAFLGSLTRFEPRRASCLAARPQPSFGMDGCFSASRRVSSQRASMERGTVVRPPRTRKSAASRVRTQRCQGVSNQRARARPEVAAA